MSLFKNTLIIILLFSSISAYSQGFISGKVIDGENGEPLRGATIQLLGTKLGAYSDIKGEFKIKKVPEGEYNCRISFIGYDPNIVQKIKVTSGQTTDIGNIIINFSKKSQEEITIVSERINDNSAAILAARKNSSQVSDGLSAQEISQTSDGDAGQSLKRVSGVTLVENKYLFVRGVSERYSNTTLNGSSLTSTEPDKKAFAFDMFPSEFLQNVQISKSFTPDLPGNFAGGLVQLNTVDFPSSTSLKVSISSMYNSNTNMQDNAYFSTEKGSTDWLGIDDGTRKLSEYVPATRREIDELRTASNNPFDQTGAKQKYERLIKSFNDKNLNMSNSTIGPISNTGFGLSYSDVFNMNDDKFGIISSLNYSNSFQINGLQRNALMADGNNFFISSGEQSNRNINWGGLLNFAYKIGSNSSISLRNIYNRSADNESIIISGQDSNYQFKDYKNYSAQWTEKTLFSSQLNGEHLFPSLINSLLNWRVGYSKSTRYEPDFRRLKFDRDLFEIEFNPDLPYEPLFVQTEYGDPNRLGRYYSDLNDNSINGGIDITIPVQQIKFKVGGLYEIRERDFNARSFAIIPPKYGNDFGQDIKDVLQHYYDPNAIFNNEHFRLDDGFRISEGSRLSDRYDASENLFAAYFMFETPINLLNEEFRFIGGVRYEDNNQKLNSFESNDAPISIERPTQDFLPSLNLIWRATDNSNVRIAASQTLTRPSLREFAPYSFYDFINQISVTGNPKLVRALIRNYDIRYEYFPNPGEVISVSVFTKTFENAIEETIFPQQSELTKTFDNAQGFAKNYGIEIEFRKGLGYFADFLKDFAVNMNLSLIKSEITVKQGGAEDTRQMWGQSPYTVNLGLFYYNPSSETSVNLAYNTFGKRIIQVAQVGIYNFDDSHIYELPRNLIDLTISQSITNNLDVKLSIRDLLNDGVVWEQGGKRVSSTLRGTSASLSFGYKIF